MEETDRLLELGKVPIGKIIPYSEFFYDETDNWPDRVTVMARDEVIRQPYLPTYPDFVEYIGFVKRTFERDAGGWKRVA